MQRIFIALNHNEQRIAKWIASERGKNKRQTGIQDKRWVDDKTSEQIDRQGEYGEFAFAKLMNLFPDFDTSRPDSGHDFKMPNGKTVDVKTTDGDLYPLQIELTHNGRVDYFALMIGFPPDSDDFDGVYRYAGMIDAKSAMTEKYIKPIRDRMAYRIPQSDLFPLPEELWFMLPVIGIDG